MQGIQGFYIGGSSGKAASSMPSKSFSQNQKVRDIGRRFRERRDSGGNQNNQQQIMEDMQKNFQDEQKDYQQQLIKDNNFVEDLQKLIAPSGQTYLFTQNPRTQEFMRKYGLNAQDIINLRMGVTQRGFGDKIRGVADKAVGQLRLSNLFDPRSAIDQYYQKDMTRFDRPQGGIKNFFANLLGSRFDKIAGGSPQGLAGFYYANQMGLSPEQAEMLGGVTANVPNVYQDMMNTPLMQQRNINEFIYRTQQGLPQKNDAPQTTATTPDPVVGYQAVLNPFLPNQGGITNFTV